jgi:hypothetical protein
MQFNLTNELDFIRTKRSWNNLGCLAISDIPQLMNIENDHVKFHFLFNSTFRNIETFVGIPKVISNSRMAF